MTSLTDKYIDNLYQLTKIEFPERVILQAKKCLLDYLGVTFAGARMLNNKGSAFLNMTKDQNDDIPVIGFNRKSNIYNAVFINGLSAHIAELDDGVRQGSVHPGAPIISALLPVVILNKLNGKDLLKGMIVGYEAAIQLACAIQPSHRNKGYHATGTCGTIGAAIGVGAALGFSRQQMKDALSAAATSASGILNVIKGSSELKPFNAGQAAVSGLIASFTSLAGFSGPVDVLSGEWGLIGMITEKSNLSILEKMPGNKYAIEMVYMKPYAACRHSHPAIEATLELKRKHNILHEHVKEIQVVTYNLATNGHDHIEINGITDAKMSTPFSVAVALVTGKAGIDEYTDKYIHDSEVCKLTKKTKVVTDDNINALVPAKRPAIVNVLMNDHQLFSARVDLAKGEPENPLSIDEITEKFYSLSQYGGKTGNDGDSIANAVWNIETEISNIINRL